MWFLHMYMVPYVLSTPLKCSNIRATVCAVLAPHHPPPRFTPSSLPVGSTVLSTCLAAAPAPPWPEPLRCCRRKPRWKPRIASETSPNPASPSETSEFGGVSNGGGDGAQGFRWWWRQGFEVARDISRVSRLLVIFLAQRGSRRG